MQKTLIVVGLSIVILGILWPWLAKFPLGRLPGDILIEKNHSKFYIPISSMIVLSILLSLLSYIFRK